MNPACQPPGEPPFKPPDARTTISTTTLQIDNDLYEEFYEEVNSDGQRQRPATITSDHYQRPAMPLPDPTAQEEEMGDEMKDAVQDEINHRPTRRVQMNVSL